MNDQTAMTDEQFNALEAQFPDAALVARYREIRDFLAAEVEAQTAHVKPHIENMTAIANELHRRLLKRNPGWRPGMTASGSTEHGTFFLKTNSSIKVAERDVFFQFLVEPPELGPILVGNPLVKQVCAIIFARLREFVTAHVAKEGVEGYTSQIEQYRREHGGALPPGVTGTLPPGITVEQIIQLQVRKT